MTSFNLVDEIYKTIIEMHENTGYSKHSINEYKIKSMIQDRISNGFVYFDGKCLMLGNAYTPWFSDEIFASDTILYTKKEHRGEYRAERAVKDFIEWAKEIGATNISISQSTGVNNKEFNSLAEKLGLIKIGAVYNV